MPSDHGHYGQGSQKSKVQETQLLLSALVPSLLLPLVWLLVSHIHLLEAPPAVP
jgi:hypothetical protein